MDRLQKVDQQFTTTTSTAQQPKKLCENDLKFFRSFIPEERILTDPKQLQIYNIDTQRIFKGNSKLLLFPISTEEVSKIMAYCTEHYLQVVLQSGHSSLVGGGTPAKEEVILNFSKFNKIVNLNEQSMVLTCEPGCILAKVQKYLNQKNMQLPYDIMSRERCMIGGNVATHAGGVMYCKFGPLRSYILGLEIVLADGQVLNMGSENRKDNTLQDLKQLFIGSEGTLGIVTKIQLVVVPLEKYKSAIFYKVGHFNDVIKSLKVAQKILGSEMSAFEAYDYVSYRAVHKMLGKTIPFPFSVDENQEGKYYNLIEITSRKPQDLLQKELFEGLQEQNIIEEYSWGKNDDANFRNNWMIRKMVANAFMGQGIMLAFDISLNITEFHSFIQKVRNWTGKVVGGFGHMGDGNLHLAIMCENDDELVKVNDILKKHFYTYLQSIGGSISAEHGIGRQKAEKMIYAKTELQLKYIADIKKLFDPKNILNPYAFESSNFSKYNVLKYSCW